MKFLVEIAWCLFIARQVWTHSPDVAIPSSPLDETSVLKMGRQFGNPLLLLLGTAMRNSKMDVLGKVCSLKICDEWSEWSTCPVETKGQFGVIKRSRECGRAPSFCQRQESPSVITEMDSKLCMGENCPEGFNKTDNGFCFLLNNTTLTRDDAGKFCEDRGGLVVSVTTKSKSDDLNNFLKSSGKTGSTIWADARRKDSASPWKYSYETGPGNYSNWQSSKPDNELCMCYKGYWLVWSDTECDKKYMLVCEFV